MTGTAAACRWIAVSLTETTAKFGIYNESTLSKWERIYYEEGESGLYRDNRGKMRTKPNKQELQPQEENDLRVENQRLRAEVAYLKKLRVLVEDALELPYMALPVAFLISEPVQAVVFT